MKFITLKLRAHIFRFETNTCSLCYILLEILYFIRPLIPRDKFETTKSISAITIAADHG